jgi:uncharacterized membrane protein HdeD (DUF308 family)
MTNAIKQITRSIKYWWLYLIAGIIFLVGSIWVIMTPIESYVTLAWLFSILVLADGIAQTIFSVSNREELKGWGWRLAGGILMIIMGIILILYPGISIVILPFVVGFWLLFAGIYLIGASLELRDFYIRDWGWLLVFGIFLIFLSFFMILRPLFGAFNVVYLTSLALMIFGIAYIVLAFKLKAIKAETYDVVGDLKKEFKKQVADLKNEIIQEVNELPDKAKEEIGKMFDDYEGKIDRK